MHIHIIFHEQLNVKVVCKYFATAQNCSQTKRRNKRVFNYCQTSVLFFYKGATLVIYRAHGPYTLVGWYSTPSCIYLDNRLYICMFSYNYYLKRSYLVTSKVCISGQGHIIMHYHTSPIVIFHAEFYKNLHTADAEYSGDLNTGHSNCGTI